MAVSDQPDTRMPLYLRRLGTGLMEMRADVTGASHFTSLALRLDRTVDRLTGWNRESTSCPREPASG